MLYPPFSIPYPLPPIRLGYPLSPIPYPPSPITYHLLAILSLGQHAVLPLPVPNKKGARRRP